MAPAPGTCSLLRVTDPPAQTGAGEYGSISLNCKLLVAALNGGVSGDRSSHPLPNNTTIYLNPSFPFVFISWAGFGAVELVTRGSVMYSGWLGRSGFTSIHLYVTCVSPGAGTTPVIVNRIRGPVHDARVGVESVPSVGPRLVVTRALLEVAGGHTLPFLITTQKYWPLCSSA